ncbi:hypothetical protein [Streptomyces hokutonensis]|uniref:hypothetical protein n=1 Tax=Streptomyces hokutonensis TaxID=1306990 RepID=UPI0037F4EEE0
MMIAEPWYESGSFWQFAITTLVAVAVGALGAFATTRASNPKRRLDYSTPTNASLFVASHSQTGALQVTHNGTPVNRPRIIELKLRNAGRRDISAAEFHNGESMKVNVGANVVVVGVLEVKSEPASTSVPSFNIDASGAINIPPTLLARRQVVRMTILVDGPRESVQVQAPLVDVDVQGAGSTESEEAWLDRAAKYALVLLSLVMLIFLVLSRWDG